MAHYDRFCYIVIIQPQSSLHTVCPEACFSQTASFLAQLSLCSLWIVRTNAARTPNPAKDVELTDPIYFLLGAGDPATLCTMVTVRRVDGAAA